MKSEGNALNFLLWYAGIVELKQELQQNFNTLRISRLYNTEGQIQCFHSAGTLSEFTKMFSIMKQSNIFLKEWENAMNAARKSKPALTVEDFYPLVWQPAFKSCKLLLECLYMKSIKLADVDKYFKEYQSSQLEFQLLNLFDGVNACERQKWDGTWIRIVVGRMNAYWSLRKYCDAANVFLDLKRILKLNGDFGVVEKFSTEVRLCDILC